VKKIIYAQSVK